MYCNVSVIGNGKCHVSVAGQCNVMQCSVVQCDRMQCNICMSLHDIACLCVYIFVILCNVYIHTHKRINQVSNIGDSLFYEPGTIQGCFIKLWTDPRHTHTHTNGMWKIALLNYAYQRSAKILPGLFLDYQSEMQRQKCESGRFWEVVQAALEQSQCRMLGGLVSRLVRCWSDHHHPLAVVEALAKSWIVKLCCCCCFLWLFCSSNCE